MNRVSREISLFTPVLTCLSSPVQNTDAVSFPRMQVLYNFNYATGNTTADWDTQHLMHHLLDTDSLHACGAVLTAFDESVMFSQPLQRYRVCVYFNCDR